MEDVVIHRTDRYGELSWASVATALDLSSRCLEPRAQLAALDAAVRQGLVPLRIARRFTITPRAQRDWLDAHVDPRSESPGETFARVLLVEAGFKPVVQRRYPAIGRVDLVVEGIVIEIDGATYHSDPQAFLNDRHRDRTHTINGRDFLRFTFAEVRDRPDEVLADVLATVWRVRSEG
ncbi:endonuclease domain-containing protein [Demequina salsinemoris]|uniref:endonuclease domain-containing protein n=1 Tax=Demequina salsinemoris TaxID=577470 RepID=UPI001F33DFFA|nr:DUF559 domain-containing protein [Demequina salsinemoris]